MSNGAWTTQAKLEISGNAHQVLSVFFWLWGVVGFFINALFFLSIPSSVGVGTSAYIAACLLFWIGGMLFFGLGALVSGGRYNFIRRES